MKGAASCPPSTACPPDVNRCLIYARQSVEKAGAEHSLSLDSQVAVCEERCAAEGWQLTAVIREAGRRGHRDADERPGLAEAIARAEAGEYDVLLVWRLCRFFRDQYLQEGVVRQLRRLGVRVVSHTQPHAVDDMIRNIEALVDQRRREEIALNVRRAMAERRRRGLFQGRVPMGLLRPDATSPLVIDPEPADVVAEVYAMRLEHLGPSAIARALNARGIFTPEGHRWSATTVMRLISQAAYRGAVESRGETIEDAHPAIVDAATWHAAQCTPNGHRSPRAKAAASWLEGLVEHACGRPMYLARRAYRHPALRCRWDDRVGPCPIQPRMMRLDRAEALAWERIAADLEGILEPDAVLAAAHVEYGRLAPAAAAARTDALERQKRAAERRSRAEDLYLSGARERAWFDAEDALAASALADAERILAHLPTPPDPDAIGAVWQRLTGMREVLASIEGMDRRPVLAELGRVVVAPPDVALRYARECRAFLGSVANSQR